MVFISLLLIQMETLPKSGVNIQQMQLAKKVVSDSPGLVDFAIGLMDSVVNLPVASEEFSENWNYRSTVRQMF